MTALTLILRTYWRQILAVVLALYFAVTIVGKIRDYGQRQYQAGRAAVIAEDAAQAAQAVKDADKRAADAAAAGVAMHSQLDIVLPKLEVATHDAIDKIHTIYFAAPAGPDAVCVRPPGVQAELDAARHRANAAAGGDL